MRLFNHKTANGTISPYRQSVDRQLHKAEDVVAAYPGAGLLLATLFGMLLGIWIKRT
jgi:hypothetical protein